MEVEDVGRYWKKKHFDDFFSGPTLLDQCMPRVYVIAYLNKYDKSMKCTLI